MTTSTIYAEKMGLKNDGNLRLRFLGETGWLALQLGDVENAEKIFRGIVAAAPKCAMGGLGLAEVLLRRRQYSAARIEAVRVQTAHDVSATVSAQGLILESRIACAGGDIEEARRLLDEAGALDPDGPSGSAASELRRRLDSFFSWIDKRSQTTASEN